MVSKRLEFPKRDRTRRRGFTQSSACVFHCCMRDNWGTAGGKANTNVYARRKCSAEYKRGWEQRRVKGERSKCICFNYVEKGQLLWWQIIKDAMRAHVIKNLCIYEHSWILIVEIRNTLKGFTANAPSSVFSFFMFFPLMISILWYYEVLRLCHKEMNQFFWLDLICRSHI